MEVQNTYRGSDASVFRKLATSSITNYMTIQRTLSKGVDYMLETETICPLGKYNLKMESVAQANRLNTINSLFYKILGNEDLIANSIRFI